jgi:hypothetical protein
MVNSRGRSLVSRHFQTRLADTLMGVKDRRFYQALETSSCYWRLLPVIFPYEHLIYHFGVIIILIHNGPPHLYACGTGSMVSIFYFGKGIGEHELVDLQMMEATWPMPRR